MWLCVCLVVFCVPAVAAAAGATAASAAEGGAADPAGVVDSAADPAAESDPEEPGEPVNPEVWDVLVVGSDPEGIAAAVAAARLGSATVLVDHRERVGGLYTVGGLNMLDLNYKYPGLPELIHTGFFAEFHRAMGGYGAFDIGRAERWFETVLAEAGVRVFLGQEFVAPLMERGRVVGIRTAAGEQTREFRARRVIDATPDADVAAAAGAPYRTGRAEFGRPDVYAAATLVFALEGVDWFTVARYLWADANPATGVLNRVAWGYPHMFRYQARDPQLQLRGLNLGLQDDGTVVVNALQVFGVDPLDPESRRRGLEGARTELPRIVEYMRWHCPGFAEAELAWVAEELYIRESRRIVGLDTVTGEDVFRNRFPWDTVAVGSYPVDLQATRPGERGVALAGTRPYGIPFGALVPQKVDNLLVVGKAASFDIIAHGSARTVPVGMSTGQAAGVAAHYAVENDLTFREISGERAAVGAIRRLLAEQGVDLRPVILARPEEEHWAFPYLQWLRERALLSAGYQNGYPVDEPASVRDLGASVLGLAVKFYGLDFDLDQLGVYRLNPSPLADWERLAAQVLWTERRSLAELYREGILDPEVYIELREREHPYLTHGEAYAFLANVLQAAQKGDRLLF